MGRARQTPIIAIDDGLPKRGERSGAASAVSRVAAGGGRIQVEFNRQMDEQPRRLERQSETTGSYAKPRVSRVLMYTLLVLVLVAGAFYGGLRASDFINNGASNANANREADPLQLGREAFEGGDYKLAAAEFDSLSKRDPSNARALYWLGRAQLEQREYEMAVKSFEAAVARQPSMHEAYVHQAAAYEAMGERSKAAAALSRYAEERRKNEH